MKRMVTVWVVILSALIVAPVGAALTYHLAPLGFERPYDINGHGWIVGYNFDSGRQYQIPVLWRPDLGIRNLGDLPGGSPYGIATAINNLGQVVGWASATGGTRAFLWQEDIGMLNLGTLPGYYEYSYAYGINDLGQIVGNSETNGGTIGRAFLREPGGNMTNLGDFPGGSELSSALAVNSLGQVVGYSGGLTGWRAFIWESKSGMADLGELPSGSSPNYAVDINEVGQIVGFGQTEVGIRSFIWTRTTGMVNIGVPVGFDDATAHSINNSGTVVGHLSGGPSGWTPFVWDNLNGFRKLPQLIDKSGSGWRLSDVTAINDYGQIVGFGINPVGDEEAFLLIPIPEPSSFFALCGGVAGLLVFRRRRK